MPTLDPEELAQLLPAETAAFASPIPTQFVSSDEFMPLPQTRKQKEVEARVRELGSQLAKHQGLSRRRFFQTAAGMAAAFVAMNDVYGPLFGVSRAEAATPELADERAKALAGEFIMDMHTHFLRDDTRLEGFVRSREAVGKAGWNPALAGKPQTIEDLKFANYFKEIYFDSDTEGRAHLGIGLGGAARLVPHQRDEGRGPRQGEQAYRLEAADGPRHLHARDAGLAGGGGPGDRRAPAGFVQGLHGGR